MNNFFLGVFMWVLFVTFAVLFAVGMQDAPVYGPIIAAPVFILIEAGFAFTAIDCWIEWTRTLR